MHCTFFIMRAVRRNRVEFTESVRVVARPTALKGLIVLIPNLGLLNFFFGGTLICDMFMICDMIQRGGVAV
jgi:hypothetical protein